jgi:hypothetical protein
MGNINQPRIFINGRYEILKDLIIYVIFTLVYISLAKDFLFTNKVFLAPEVCVPPLHPVPTIESLLNEIFSAWSASSLGTPMLSFDVRFFLRNLLYALSFNNRPLAQKLQVLHTYFAFYTMIFLIRNHFTKSRVGSFFGAMIYALAPTVTMRLSEYLWGYTFIPLFLNYMLNILKGSRRLKDPAFFALSAAFMISYASYIIPMSLLILAVFVPPFFLNYKKRKMLKLTIFFKRSILALVLVIGLLSSFFLHSYLMWSGTYASTILKDESNALPLFKWLYRQWNLNSAIRLFEESSMLTTSALIYGTLIVLMASIPLLLRHRLTDDVKLCSLIFWIIILLTLSFGLNAKNLSWPFILIYRTAPPLILLLRNACVTIFLIVLSIGCLSAIGLSLVAESMMKVVRIKLSTFHFKPECEKLQSIFVLIFILSSLAFSYRISYPFREGMGSGPNPLVYEHIASWLASQDDKARYLILPHSMDTTYNSPQFPRMIAPSGTMTYEEASYLHFIQDILFKNCTRHLGTILAPIGVRYVIINMREQEGFPYIGPETLTRLLSHQQDLTLAAKYEDFIVYENLRYIPHIALYSEDLLRINSKESLLSMVDSATFKMPLVNEPYVVEEYLDKYVVKMQLYQPVFIVLSEAYHPEWHAYVNGRELSHFRAFSVTNGFFINVTGNITVTIEFGLTKIRALLVLPCLTSFILAILIALYDSKQFIAKIIRNVSTLSRLKLNPREK